MASTAPANTAFGTIQLLARQREDIVRELAQLSETDCRAPAQWAGIQRNVNFLLRAFSLHELDHLQHLQKLVAARGRSFNEPQLLLAKAQALRGELLSLLLSLSDEEFDTGGPGADDWSPRQIVEHLLEVDAGYANNIRNAVAVSAGASLTGPGFCGTRCVSETPSPIDLSRLADRYSVTPSVVEDLYARRRAGARDAELVNLLQQADRGGLDAERAHALVAELPER